MTISSLKSQADEAKQLALFKCSLRKADLDDYRAATQTVSSFMRVAASFPKAPVREPGNGRGNWHSDWTHADYERMHASDEEHRKAFDKGTLQREYEKKMEECNAKLRRSEGERERAGATIEKLRDRVSKYHQMTSTIESELNNKLSLCLSRLKKEQQAERRFERNIISAHPKTRNYKTQHHRPERASSSPRDSNNEFNKKPIVSSVISLEDWAAASTINLPPYPQELQNFLAENCTIWPGKKRSETHIVVPLFPMVAINGSPIPLTLESLDQLDKSSGGPGYNYLWGPIPKNIPADKEFCYAVMTCDVIPESRNKPYEAQTQLLPAGYEVPSIFDAARAILWKNRRSGKKFFSNSPATYTQCKEVVQRWNLVVGGFVPSGLYVSCGYGGDYEDVGVAGWRKFAESARAVSDMSLRKCESKANSPSEVTKKPIVSSVVSLEDWAAASTINLPPYPQELQNFLAENCTIWPGKKRSETHIVVPLFPMVNINGAPIPLTLESLGLLDARSGGTGYRTTQATWNKIDQNVPADKEFCYAVMTNNEIPGSRNKPHEEKIQLLPIGYEEPAVLDVLRAILWENRRSGKQLFPSTACKEVIGGMRLVVLESPPCIEHYSSYDYNKFSGVTGWRKFAESAQTVPDTSLRKCESKADAPSEVTKKPIVSSSVRKLCSFFEAKKK